MGRGTLRTSFCFARLLRRGRAGHSLATWASPYETVCHKAMFIALGRFTIHVYLPVCHGSTSSAGIWAPCCVCAAILAGSVVFFSRPLPCT